MRVWVPFAEAATEVCRRGISDVQIYTGDALSESVAGVDFLVLPHPFVPQSVRVLDRMPNLKVVQLLSSGFDHALPHIREGILVCNAPNLHGRPTAEVAMALILASLNHVPEWVLGQTRHEWRDPGPRPTLFGKEVLLIGYGAVGKALHEMLSGFQVNIVPVAPQPRPGVVGIRDLRDRLRTADIIVVAVPSANDTRALIGGETLALIKDGALVVNVSRGPVVVTNALVEHLRTGRLRAALDVTDPEPLPPTHALWTCPGAIISPHVGGNTADFRQRAAAFVGDQIRRYCTGQAPLNIVRQ